MILPSAEIPGSLRGFFGIWQGVWDKEAPHGGLPVYFVVESITDSTHAKVRLTSGDLPQFGIKKGGETTVINASISSKEEITFGQTSPTQYAFTYDDYDGVVRGRFINRDGSLSRVVMTRCEFPKGG
jgi:hypothetical protein